MSGKIRVAIVGVGNCASSLVQGVTYYKDIKEEGRVPGIITSNFAGYYPSDIKFVAAFDIDRRKVGKDLSKAIYEKPNCTTIFEPGVPNLDCKVLQGYSLDSIADQTYDFPIENRFDPLEEIYDSYEEAKKAVIAVLKASRTEILVNYLPVGSERAARFYAGCCLEARIAMVNAMPVFISRFWGNRFKEAGVPIVGDDIKSQVGATIVHRVLTKMFEDRGQRVQKSYQLNVGGNQDFLNMIDRTRLSSKRISKTNAVTSQMEHKIEDENIYVGPSDYVPWLKDNKVCFIRMEANQYGDVPMNLEIRLSVEDSPNSAGVITDAIRGAKVALDRKLSGPIIEVSSYLFKSPVIQFDDTTARDMLRKFARHDHDHISQMKEKHSSTWETGPGR